MTTPEYALLKWQAEKLLEDIAAAEMAEFQSGYMMARDNWRAFHGEIPWVDVNVSVPPFNTLVLLDLEGLGMRIGMLHFHESDIWLKEQNGPDAPVDTALLGRWLLLIPEDNANVPTAAPTEIGVSGLEELEVLGQTLLQFQFKVEGPHVALIMKGGEELLRLIEAYKELRRELERTETARSTLDVQLRRHEDPDYDKDDTDEPMPTL